MKARNTASSMADPIDELPMQHLQQQLRLLRQAQGWSLNRAAQATGLSKAMLGQIERGESSPTLASLWKIASGFGCSISSLISPPVSNQAGTMAPLFRSADDLRSQPAQDEMLVSTVFPWQADVDFELLELTLLPGYHRLAEPHAPRVIEHLIVLQGEMEVLIGGTWHRLAQGQAVRFAADTVHGYRNTGTAPARCHDIIHYGQTAR